MKRADIIANKTTTEKTELYCHIISEKCVYFDLMLAEKCVMLKARYRKDGDLLET